VPVRLGLADLVGEDYVRCAAGAAAALRGQPPQGGVEAMEPVEFLPEAFLRRQGELLKLVGQQVIPAVQRPAAGASTAAFDQATHVGRAPLSGLGMFRVGEDGRLYLIAKAEHYHVALGHGFPGFELLGKARALGIPSATHNNTRGHITRQLERELVRLANGLAPGDADGLERACASASPQVINRVLNLETGSLAMEAAMKLLLARFYRPQSDCPAPKYDGRTPVLLVLGDDDGTATANYHGTTVITQILRGMWPQVAAAMEDRAVMLVRPVRVNDVAGLKAAFDQWDRPPHKIAGFLHELVLMNYGARRVAEDFIQLAYRLCREQDVPPVCDEIQTGLWSPRLLMYHEYGLRPSVVALGKGFPGGEYPASRVLFSSDLDNLPQFGALVTNGQEELASLAFLVALPWAEANADHTRRLGDYYQQRLTDLAGRFSRHVATIDGSRHMLGLRFTSLATAKAVVADLVERGLDISVQTYKSSFPPTALTKLPLIATADVIDFVVEQIEEALARQG
jgi:acetylornithine/succinyldiaminopimelate/putrescine aminotransferase